jgi:hypothetical protein
MTEKNDDDAKHYRLKNQTANEHKSDKHQNEYIKKDEIDDIIDKKLKNLIAKPKYFVTGFSMCILVVAGLLASDPFVLDIFTREAFAIMFKIDQRIDNRANNAIDTYFSNTDFRSGTYASSSEVRIIKCDSVFFNLPFQSDIEKHKIFVHYSIAFPEGEHIYDITPVINSTVIGNQLIFPIELKYSNVKYSSFEITEIMKKTPIDMRSSGFIHDYWMRIDVMPPTDRKSLNLVTTSKTSELNGLPDKPTSTECPPVNGRIKVHLLIQVAGDPRIPSMQK